MSLRQFILFNSCSSSYISKRVVMVRSIRLLKVQPGTFEIIILIIIFVGLQAWWIIPIIKRNNKMNESGKDLSEEVKKLERIFKK